MSKTCYLLRSHRLKVFLVAWIMIAGLAFHKSKPWHYQYLDHIVTIQRKASVIQDQSSFKSSTNNPFPFPSKIWQTGPSTNHTKDNALRILSWLQKNPDFRYEFLTDRGAEQYVRDHFSNHPEIMRMYFEVHDVILRADMFRLLVMLGSGGVYSDIDTSCTVPVEEWIPETYFSKARLVIGVELDLADANDTEEERKRFQLCQWTLLAAPGNKHLKNVVSYIFSQIQELATEQHITLQELGDYMTVPKVITTTGPIAFTNGLLGSLSRTLNEPIEDTTRRITRLKAPLLLDDVLFLPINAFGDHQRHSHSGESGWGEKLVQHYWASSWWAAKDHKNQ